MSGTRIAHFIELMELLNPHPRWKVLPCYLPCFEHHSFPLLCNLENWPEFLPGRWRLLYCTGRHISLTLRQPSLRVFIGSAYLTFTPLSNSETPDFSPTSGISFSVMPSSNLPHDKSGTVGNLHITSPVRVAPGRRLYLREESTEPSPFSPQESAVWKVSSRKWKAIGAKEPPFGLPTTKLVTGEIDVKMRLDPMPSTSEEAGNVLREVRTQIPPEMFDVSKLVCGTYIDLRLMVLGSVNGSALLFTWSCCAN